MKRNWVIIVLGILLLTLIAILFVYQHKANEKVFLSYFQEHQLLHAQHLAEQIKTLLWANRRILESLPSFTSHPIEDMERLKRDIRAYSSHMEEDYIDKISLYDKKGITFYSTESKAIGLGQDQSLFFLWAQRKENRGRLFTSPLLTGEENWQAQMQPKSSDRKDISFNDFKIFLAIPLYHRAFSKKSGQWDWEFTGILSFLIDLEKFLANELKDYKLSEHRVWIIDRDSTILFHSGHPEMKSRNVRQRDETCNQCHTSFNFMDEISGKGEGTTDYTVKDLPRKLGGFASVKYADISWVVVVNSTYDMASASIRKSLRHSLLLLGTVVLSFLLGSAYLIRNERMRVSAEAESRHWQALTAERKKSEEVVKRSEEQLRYLSYRLLTAQEEERSRISRDLHDGLGGALATLKLREGLMKGNFKEDQVELIKECEKTIEYIEQTMEEVDRMLRNLTPSVLEHLGLSAALQWLANDHSKRDNVKVALDINDIDPVLSKEAQITVFRIFQEAFKNIEKYAHATNVSVAAVIRKEMNDTSFSIKDDGRGFDLLKVFSQNVTERGLGLAIMEERARMLGGHLEIWSEEGKGTQITFRIPNAERKGS